MILLKIRNANPEELKKAIQEMIQHQAKLTLGELHATSRVIMERAEKLGISKDLLNSWARGES